MDSFNNCVMSEDRLSIEHSDDKTADSCNEKVCRICLSSTMSYVDLKNPQNDEYLLTMVTTCLPQLNFNLTKDPIICQKCLTKLEEFHKFLIICLDTENKLINYCKACNITTLIDIVDILNVSSNEKEGVLVKREVDINEKQVEIKVEETAMLIEDFDLEENLRPGLKKKSFKNNKDKPFSKDLIKGIYKCNECDKNFTSKWGLDRHVSVHKLARNFVCETCNAEFKYKHSFQKHLVVHLSEAPASKPFACDICGKFFNRKSKMKKHQEIHVIKNKPFGCITCGKRFTDEDLLNSHIYRVHNSDKAFSCNICGNKYSSKSGLDVHMKSHLPNDKPKPEPDLMCDFCGKLFYRKYALEKHRMSHTGEKPFECEECDMKFKERYHLRVHMRRHTGEKPYDCEICGFKFASKNRLGVHMRIHTGVRPFPCQMCDMAFTRKDHLIKHVRAIHTGERPFACDICDKTFNRRDYLLKHKKVHVKKML